MTENGVKTDILKAGSDSAAEYGLGATVSTSRLVRRTAARLRAIRETYKKALLGALPATRNYIPREWLCDNYYIIDREARAALKWLKSCDRLPSAAGTELPFVYIMALKLCESVSGVGEGDAELFLEGVQQVGNLSNSELFSFKAMLAAASVELIWRECGGISSSDGGNSEIMAGCVGTLRSLSSMDLTDSLERLSCLEKILLRDPAGLYGSMSDDTKAYYRRRITSRAKRMGVSEAEFAAWALERAQAADGGEREKHIGTYIFDTPDKLTGGKLYIALYFAVPLLLSAGATLITGSLLTGAILLLPLWDIYKSLSDSVAAAFMKPRFVCSMKPSCVRPDARTVVVISCLITSADQIKKLAQNLLRIRLSGAETACGLLADFKESSGPTRPEDEHLTVVLRKEIDKLNKEKGGRFFAVVRKRTFAEREGKYMGWERKRGAVTEFIRFMRGANADFAITTGDFGGVAQSRYLLTIDADTELSINAAMELTAVLEHPLNKPVVVNNSVVGGFAMAVPRLTTDIESSAKTFFSRAFAGLGGLHSYCGAGGDFYQDIFGEGHFTGKGLINAEVFSLVVDGAFPTERVLSHDVLEGGVLRACFVSETELSDSFPTTVKSWLLRLSRWLRGDFQNSFFLGSTYRNEKGEQRKTGFDLFDRFKLFENIRRGITPVFILAALIICAALRFEFRAAVIAASLTACASGDVISTLRGIFRPAGAIRRYITRGIPAFLAGLARIVINILMLPQISFIALVSAWKSFWRSNISHKNMLEWLTAAEAEQSRKNGVVDYYRYMWFTLLSGVCFLLARSLFLTVLGAVWMIAPMILCEISRPRSEKSNALDESDEELLFSSAAAMWRFFDKYVTAETNWLPPDNVQYSPYKTAMRTSPTNIGLYLLCVLTARDLGFIDSRELCERTAATLATVARLKKWYGNLYNWYDIKTEETLKPEYVSTVDSGNFLCCLTALKEGLREFRAECAELDEVAAECERLIAAADISKLYNERRRLFYIGYDAAAESYGNNAYDLLMSEARMTSYYAVAKKVADKKHWGSLGRLSAGQDGYVGPISWTGTVFEYFMPHLLIPVTENSLTDEALRYALYCQKKRVAQRKLPWGISESGFYSFDIGQNYQYKAFGVQKLGLKRGLDNELVVSPYSSYLTLFFAPNEAVNNIRQLIKMGLNGEFGLYEAVDFTKSRTGGGFAIVKSYMAHHMGMSLVSVDNCLLGNVMQKRFMRDEDMQTAQRLLDEAILENVQVFRDISVADDVQLRARRVAESGLVCSDADADAPRAMLLSNGEFSTLVTDGGCGFSIWNGLEVTAKKRSIRFNPRGVFVMLKEERKEAFCITVDPLRDGVLRKIEFSSSSALFTAVKDGLEAAMGVLVHGRIPAEIRMIKVGNTDKRRKEAELLIYLEPVLQREAEHEAHPAFSDLFIMCEYRAEERCLLIWRRGDEEEEACIACGFAERDAEFEFETDRSRILKKAQGVFSLKEAFGSEFSNRCGAPVIPCAAFRTRLSLKGGANTKLMFIQCAGKNREEALSRFMIVRRQNQQAVMKTASDAANDMAASVACTAEENRLSAGILPRVFYDLPKTALSVSANDINRLGREELWSLSVSGDLPIVTLIISDSGGLTRARAYLTVQRVMAIKGALFDLCLVYSEGGDYEGETAAAIEELIVKHGGSRARIFAIDAAKTGGERIELLKAISVYCEQTGRINAEPISASGGSFTVSSAEPSVNTEGVRFSVPGGGFEKNAFVTFDFKNKSPLPWCFPLGNPIFGTLVSDKSLGFTYFGNSRQNTLTPWGNDYMTDNNGERLFAECDGKYYELTSNAFVRFSPGTAEYRTAIGSLEICVKVSVHEKMPVKITETSVFNGSPEEKKLRIAFLALPSMCNGANTLLSVEKREGCLLMRNPLNSEYRNMRAALSGTGETVYISGQKSFFSGEWKEALPKDELPCAAAVSELRIGAGERKRQRFFLSMARGERAALFPHKLLGDSEPLSVSRNDAAAFRINTPSPELDCIINTFFPYQTKVSRLMGRSGFSQNSGAYGFRDQLQDVCALLYSDPELAKRQILRAASVQFEEGDVLHWWHRLPADGGGIKGVRSRCSDDLLWLPYTVSRYVSVTGDRGILDINVNFIKGDNLLFNENEKYLSPLRSDAGSIYEHCRRALDRGYRTGSHGLMLFGSGDWNDGMNKVGVKGKGESVWLSMFAAYTADAFSEISDVRSDAGYSRELRERAMHLREAVETHAWDGDRYLRGFHDDGSRIGSESCDECRIDSLSQSFSVLCGFDANRSDIAIRTACSKLILKDSMIVRLFTPPYEKTPRSVGYIKRYPPGIRENGGQYTHAAVWLAKAAFARGENDLGYEILEMISPVTHSYDKAYMTEPYFAAADIYTNRMHLGRGGWTIYTGAAAWYYRTVIENMLGFDKKGRILRISPKVPSFWNGFEVEAVLDGTILHITAERTGRSTLTVNDGTSAEFILLDGSEKSVRVEF